jgi:hypothetical protein
VENAGLSTSGENNGASPVPAFRPGSRKAATAAIRRNIKVSRRYRICAVRLMSLRIDQVAHRRLPGEIAVYLAFDCAVGLGLPFMLTQMLGPGVH